MANLGNSKIKDTYTLVLQTDAEGNLQNLDGTTPSPFIVNGNLRYTDGTQSNGYVLTSDDKGNASWVENSHASTIWSANTDGSISPSGLTTNIGLGTSTPNKPLTVVGDISGTTNLYVSGDTHTTNLILGVGGYIMPAISSNTVKMRAQDYDGEMLSIGPDLFNINMNEAANLTITPSAVTFNASAIDQNFFVLSNTSTNHIATDAQYDLLALGNAGGTSIGGIAQRWPTSTGYADTTPNKTLQVNGITTIHSGGTGNSWSADTTALTVVGDISGTTNLYIDDNIRGLRGQFGNLPAAAGANRDLDIKGDNNVYLRLQSTTNANQSIEFMNDQEPDFVIYNQHSDGGLHIASDDKSFLIIGANDGDTIDLYGNTTISGNTTLSGNTLYSGTLSGTGSVTAVGGFVGEVTGNASTATKIASITNANIVQLDETQTLTNKTLTTPVISSISNTGTVTLPTSTDTLVGRATTDTLTNKTLTSPTLTTPALGTPTSGVLTNTTGYPGDTNLVTVGTVTTGTWASNTRFEMSASDPLGSGKGDIMYSGEITTIPGGIYYYSTLGTWLPTDANATSTSTGLLAVALDDNSSKGMLLRGMVTLATDSGPIASPVYLSETESEGTTTAPTTAAAVVRVIGYSMATVTTQIWFNPDNTWVELSS